MAVTLLLLVLAAPGFHMGTFENVSLLMNHKHSSFAFK
jgi:hypothetical protein